MTMEDYREPLSINGLEIHTSLPTEGALHPQTDDEGVIRWLVIDRDADCLLDRGDDVVTDLSYGDSPSEISARILECGDCGDCVIDHDGHDGCRAPIKSDDYRAWINKEWFMAGSWGEIDPRDPHILNGHTCIRVDIAHDGDRNQAYIDRLVADYQLWINGEYYAICELSINDHGRAVEKYTGGFVGLDSVLSADGTIGH